jgi:hypothetical protein
MGTAGKQLPPGRFCKGSVWLATDVIGGLSEAHPDLRSGCKRLSISKEGGQSFYGISVSISEITGNSTALYAQAVVKYNT